MTSLFQENQVAGLEQKLAAAQKQIGQLERDHDRLGGLLAEAKGMAAAHEKRAELAETEKLQLEAKLTAAQQIVVKAAAHEKAANEANKRAAAVESQLQKAESRAEKAEEAVKVYYARIEELADRCSGYEREIGPFRVLIAALDARRQAEETIAAESERLAGG